MRNTLGPEAFVSGFLLLSQSVALCTFWHQRVPAQEVHLPAHKAIHAAEHSRLLARIARGRIKSTRLSS